MGLFEHERLKPAVIRTNQGNVCNLAQLKQVVALGMVVQWQIGKMLKFITCGIHLTRPHVDVCTIDHKLPQLCN